MTMNDDQTLATANMSPKAWCYLRVSTSRQDEESQRTQIEGYLKKYPDHEPCFRTDHITGAKPWAERRLGEILHEAQRGDIIVVTEVTRIERTLYGVLQFAIFAQDKGIELHAIKSGLRFDNSLNSKINLSMLAIAGEIERDMNNARARAGVQTRREKGLPLGRIPGTIVKLKLDEFRNEIPKWRAKKLSLRAIAKLTDSSVPTVKRWLARNATPPNEGATP